MLNCQESRSDPDFFEAPGDLSVGGVYRPSLGLWSIRGRTSVYFGGRDDDIPAPLDYNGDSVSDIAVFDRSSGRWAIRGISWFYFGVD